jgi:hypothetical protein
MTSRSCNHHQWLPTENKSRVVLAKTAASGRTTMTLWRVLTHAQAESEFERIELQLLQLEGALNYLDRASTAGDAEWIRCATLVACRTAAQTANSMASLSPTPSQCSRYASALAALDRRVVIAEANEERVPEERDPERPAAS